MKILWVGSAYLHPTTRGGQIRSLEMLKRLHRWHEIHYAALADPDEPEGPARASEYCARTYPVPHRIAGKRSPRFFTQLARGLLLPAPVMVVRRRSSPMKAMLSQLLKEEQFDSVVCDFLSPSINMPNLGRCVLFQHNVETTIWRRLADNAPDPAWRIYSRMQAEKMLRYERDVCQRVRHVVVVSRRDAERMRDWCGVSDVSVVSTGVDTEYFAPPPAPDPVADLVFIGSMDWQPNIDGVKYFVGEILPRIRRQRPHCTLAVVGRAPGASITALARADPAIRVTSTVPDVRPYLWGGAVSIVPLRIGGGTRLKIYESMAAKTAVVSTSIGAEGLTIHPPADIRIADTPEEFAGQCLRLLENPAERRTVEGAGWEMVRSRFSWEQVTRQFAEILERHRLPVDQQVPHA